MSRDAFDKRTMDLLWGKPSNKGRRPGDHVWEEGTGSTGSRGTPRDRCSLCGLERWKSNGARYYGRPQAGRIVLVTGSPNCVPSDLKGHTS